MRMFLKAICMVCVVAASATARDLTRGLTISGGGNALATLKVEQVQDAAAADRELTLRVLVGQARDLKGDGLSLAYDPAKYAFVEARAAYGNLLTRSLGQETLFLASDRTLGRVDIGAVRVDGDGISGDGKLVEFVFRATTTPSSSDFQVSDAVLIGLDDAVDRLNHVEIGDLTPLPDRFGLDQNTSNPFNPSTVIGYQIAETGRAHLAIPPACSQRVCHRISRIVDRWTYPDRNRDCHAVLREVAGCFRNGHCC